jgi:hypothetical protein
MISRNLFAPILVVSSLAAASFGIAPVANAESGGQSLKAGKVSGDSVIGAKRRFRHRFRSVKIHLPIGPTSVYYDYPYYYCRGHYPTHIGGYVYYPYPYYRCSYDWGYRGAPGSLRSHRARNN